MSELRDSTEAAPAPVCGCTRPVVEVTQTCVGCGREIESKWSLSAKAARMADLIAERVVAKLERK